MNEVINKTGEFIQNMIPEKQKKALYVMLRKIGGIEGKDSIFQKIANKIRAFKPYAFTNLVLKLIALVFKSPVVAKLSIKGYEQVLAFQEAIDAGNLEPEEAGTKLRDVLKKDSLAIKFKVPDWLINFLCEGVVLALKLLKNSKK